MQASQLPSGSVEETPTGILWGNVPEVAVPEVVAPAADSFGSICVLGWWFPAFLMLRPFNITIPRVVVTSQP